MMTMTLTGSTMNNGTYAVSTRRTCINASEAVALIGNTWADIAIALEHSSNDPGHSVTLPCGIESLFAQGAAIAARQLVDLGVAQLGTPDLAERREEVESTLATIIAAMEAWGEDYTALDLALMVQRPALLFGLAEMLDTVNADRKSRAELRTLLERYCGSNDMAQNSARLHQLFFWVDAAAKLVRQRGRANLRASQA